MRRRTAFLAYPITGSVDSARLRPAVEAIRLGLESAGWNVRPKVIDRDRQLRIMEPSVNSSTFASNVSGIETCDLLLVLAWPSETPTSIWLEVGVAIGADVPVLIADAGAAMPFLVTLAAASEPGTRGIHVISVATCVEDPGGMASHVVESCSHLVGDPPL